MQRFFRKAKKARPTLPPRTDPSSLGNVLLRMKVINSSQLVMAMLEQGSRKLGAVLVTKGYCCEADVSTALEIQALMRGGDAVAAELRLQDVLVRRLADGERRITAEIDKKDVERELRRLQAPLVAAKA